MNSFDPTLNGLYYNATQAEQSRIAAQNARRQEKDRAAQKSGAVKKTLFSSLVNTKTEETALATMGLPPEIAGLGQEEAIIFLKDRLDEAGDALSESANSQTFEAYKKAVGQFVKFIQKNNYELEEHKRKGINRRTGKPFEPRIQIRVIDEKLEQLSYDIWYNHLDRLNLLKKVHEINGLVVDLTAV